MKHYLIAALAILFFEIVNAQTLSDGEVRKVDRDAQKITIRHGPLPALDMPQAMTMVYRVADPSLLDKVKAGDKVKFEATNEKGAFVLKRIESVPAAR